MATVVIKLAFLKRNTEQAPCDVSGNREGNRGVLDKISRYAETKAGDYNHVELFLPADKYPNTVYEQIVGSDGKTIMFAHKNTGFSGGWMSSVIGHTVQPMERMSDKKGIYEYCQKEISIVDYRKMCNFAILQIGKSHDRIRSMESGIRYITWPAFKPVAYKIYPPRSDENSWYCSELVISILNQAKSTQITDVVPNDSLPQHLYDRSIGKYKEWNSLDSVKKCVVPPPPWKVCTPNQDDFNRQIQRVANRLYGIATN
jgi:hypothetical protein